MSENKNVMFLWSLFLCLFISREGANLTEVKNLILTPNVDMSSKHDHFMMTTRRSMSSGTSLQIFNRWYCGIECDPIFDSQTLTRQQESFHFSISGEANIEIPAMQAWMMNITSSLWGPTWSSQVRPLFLYVRPFFLQAQDLTARYTWQWWKRPSQPLTRRSAAHPAVLRLRISIPTPGRCPAATVSFSSGHCPAYLESTSCLLSSALLKSLEANLCLFSWNLCQYRRCGFYLWIGKIP